jgi:protein-S-isoprenylcysteine O-methyltransferase Ste14
VPTTKQKPSGLKNTRLWDLAAAAPLVVLCLLAVFGFAITIHRQWPSVFDLTNGLRIGSEFTSAIFLSLEAVMLCLRRLPVSKASGIAPRLWAIVGANFTYLILLLPRVLPTPMEALASSVLLLIGTAGSILTLTWLRRSFAIFPQAREMVTAGPYNFVRHPLYLAEQISSFGVALQFLQPWGILVALAGFAFQFPRMRYEEAVLTASFPAYREYADRKARIIPFLY